MNLSRYRDRRTAGRILANMLQPVMHSGTVVLALPRGGVGVAVEVAAAFGAPLDVFIVHRLAPAEAPDQVVGAVTSRGVCVLNRSVLQETEIDPASLAEAIANERERVEQREVYYRGFREPVEIANHPVVLVTDGIVNSVTLRAAVAAVRKQAATWVTIAAPVGSPEICDQLSQEAEEVICPLRPDPFFSVGLSYEQFPRLTDERVCDLLNEAEAVRLDRASAAFDDSFSAPYLGGSRF